MTAAHLRTTRRALLAGFAAFALAACGGAKTGGNASTAPHMPMAGDMSLGDPNAPVAVVEYASWTCGACYGFHRDVMPTIKKDFVETGKVRFVFREFPTAPPVPTVAGFAIARCAGPDKYFDVVEDLFDNQQGLLAAIRAGQTFAALEGVAARHGLDSNAFEACMSNETVKTAINDVVSRARANGITVTPTIFIDGIREGSIESRTAEGMAEILNARVAAAGVK